MELSWQRTGRYAQFPAIHNQMKDPEQVIASFCQELGEEEENIRKKVEKVSSMEKIKTNVEKETGDESVIWILQE